MLGEVSSSSLGSELPAALKTSQLLENDGDTREAASVIAAMLAPGTAVLLQTGIAVLMVAVVTELTLCWGAAGMLIIPGLVPAELWVALKVGA